MNWQGDHYKFLGTSKYWSGLGVKEIDDFLTWRENYPVTVAVLDTGIMSDHDAFKHLPATAIQGKSFIQNQNEYLDDIGHGTFCAAIIAGGNYKALVHGEKKGKKKDTGIVKSSFWNGVAPFVNLYICKIDLSDGHSVVASIIAAIKHLIKEKKDKKVQVDVISMSIGFETYSTELEKCIKEASLNNIIVVCAASNDGRTSSNSIEFPARFGDVICVGSHDYLGHESSFTSVGREIDILGPGEVESACPVPGKPTVKNAIVKYKGTSFATPYVAGMVAIILANAEQIGGQDLRKDISNNVVMKQILRKMASEPGDHSQSRGHGTLDPLQIFDFKEKFLSDIVKSIISGPTPRWSASSEDGPSCSADRAEFDTLETADKAGSWVAETDDQDQWLMMDLGQVKVVTGIITKGRNCSPGTDDQYVTEYVISYGVENGDEKFYSNTQNETIVFTGNSDRNTKVSYDFKDCSGPDTILARFIKIHPRDWQERIAMRAKIEAGEDCKLRNYDFRKVATKHTNSLDKLLQDVKFASTMDYVNLSLPERAEVRGMQGPVHLEVFCKKIKQEKVMKISCLVLPSPSDAVYSYRDKQGSERFCKGSEALQVFLTQLGDGIVSSVEDLWLKGMNGHKLALEDIKKILQKLCDLKVDDSTKLAFHCEEVDAMDSMNFYPMQEELDDDNVKVIIHHCKQVCNWRIMGRHVGMEHTISDIPNTRIIVEACLPDCRRRTIYHNHNIKEFCPTDCPSVQSSWEKQVVSPDGSVINLKLPVPKMSQAERKGMINLGFPVPPEPDLKELLSKAMDTINTQVTNSGKAVSCLILPFVSDAVWNGKDGVEAWRALLDQIGQVNNLHHLWCGGTSREPLEWKHLEEILLDLQKIQHKAGQISLTVHFFQIKELNGDSEALDIPDISNSNMKVIIHHPTSTHHSTGVCAWRQAQGLQVGREHVLNGGKITIKPCRPHCNSISKHVVPCEREGAEKMVCDAMLNQSASGDVEAPLHATMQKHQHNLKTGVHTIIAVLGSGVYVDHEDLEEVVIQDKACFVSQESWDLSVDTLGTGTALASIAAGFAGKHSHLLVAKVVDEQGRSNPAWVAKAVDWAANHKSHPADVILIPVGFEKFNLKMYEAVTKAQQNGKIVIAAAAQNRMAQEISYPARHGDVICVGSHSRTNSASSHSVRGREMDFLMMGEEHPVKAASARTGKSYNSSVSGTSVAAAMATAVVGFTLMYAESVAPTPSWSSSSKDGPSCSADRADIDSLETANKAGSWVAATDNQDQWLMMDLGQVKVVTGIITKGRNYSPDWPSESHDQYVTEYVISYGIENGDEKFYSNEDNNTETVFKGNSDRNTKVSNNFKDCSGPDTILARFIKICPQRWQGRIAMRAKIIAYSRLKSNTMMRGLLREACSSRGRHTPDRGYGTLDPDELFRWGPEHFNELVEKIPKT